MAKYGLKSGSSSGAGPLWQYTNRATGSDLSILTSTGGPSPSVGKAQGVLDSGDVQGKVKVLSIIRNSDTCLSTAFSPDGKYYAVALCNGLVNVYKSKNDNLVYTLNKFLTSQDLSTDASATCVRFRPVKRSQVKDTKEVRRSSKQGMSSRRGSVAYTELESLLPMLKGQSSGGVKRRGSSSWIRSGSLDFDVLDWEKREEATQQGLLSATFTNGSIKTYRFLTEECVQEIKEPREILTMDYDSFGHKFAAATGGGALNVYDAETGMKFTSYEPQFNEAANFRRVYAITFHNDKENEFLAGGYDGSVRFYDLRVQKHYKVLDERLFVCGEGITFNPNGKEFAVGSWCRRNTLKICDYPTGKEIQSFNSYPEDDKQPSLSSSMLYSVKYLLDGRYMVIGGAEPASVSVVELSSGKTLAGVTNVDKSIYCVAVHKSKAVATAGNEVALLDFFL